MSKSTLSESSKTVLVGLVISIGLSLFFLGVYAPALIREPDALGWAMLANTLIGMAYFFALWKFIEYLDKRLSWQQAPGRRLFIEFLGLVLIVYIISTITFVLWDWAEGERDFGKIWASLRFQNYVNVTYIPVIVTLFMEARGFLRNWREAALKAERLRFANLETRHSYLQQQIKPHFLFNSLNVLASLVHKDADLAEKFIHELSKLYRRLLEFNNREVISLEEELDAFRSYVFLIQIRFGTALGVEIDDAVLQGKKMLPPFTLQLLLENVVKHNDMSADTPIRVRATFGENDLVFSNTLRPKSRPVENSTGIGLENLRQRYALLTERPIRTEVLNGAFQVDIPLLRPEEVAKEIRAEEWPAEEGDMQRSWPRSESPSSDGVWEEEYWESGNATGKWERWRRKKKIS
jgi:Histidine kinase